MLQFQFKCSGRCYVPNTYFKSDELKYLVNERNPHQIPNAQLKRFAEKMLDIADNLANEATGAINLLPSECQRAGTFNVTIYCKSMPTLMHILIIFIVYTVLSALEIYQGIGKLIRQNEHYERRTFLSKFDKIRIVLKCMYFTSMASLYERNKNKA